MFKYLISIVVLILVLAGCSSEKQPEISENEKLEMRNTADEFTSGLRDILMSEIQSKGLVSAVSVCSDTAQIMTNDFGIRKGIYIKRVSFRFRNENNAPDNFESEGLKYFEKLFGEKKIDSLTEYTGLVKEDDITYIRYMKPIIIQAPCLNCHGNYEQIIPEVRSILNQRYKNDKAINYNIGDLRGAVSIQKVF